MTGASAAVVRQSRLESLPQWIALSLGIVLIVGPVASAIWLATRHTIWLEAFFSYAGTIYLLACSGLGAVLSFIVWRQFGSGEPLRPAWFLIFLSGASQTVGVFTHHVLASQAGLAAEIAKLSSPLYLALLAAGLAFIVAACRRNGVLPGLQLFDFVLMGIVTAFTTHYFVTVVLPTSGSGSAIQVFAAWTTDPLLCVLLLEAILILRSAANMGWGLIPRCWLAFTAAIFLTSIGDMGLWAFGQGYLPLPLVVLWWHVWFVAAAGFALGPAYQLQAMLQASRGYSLDEIEATLLAYHRVSAENEA